MSTKRERVYFRKGDPDDAFLPYAREHANAYYTQLRQWVAPTDLNRLLSHLTAISAFLDDVYADGWNDFGYVDRPSLCTLTWDMHIIVVGKKERLTSTYAYCYMMSWGLFCRTFYMLMRTTPARYALYTEQPQASYDYCQTLRMVQCISVSPRPLSQLSLRDLWNSMRLLLPTLYVYQYSTALKHYSHGLFARYCQFLTCGGELAADQDPEDVYDDPSFVEYRNVMAEEGRGPAGLAEMNGEELAAYIEEPFDAYKEVTLPLNEEYSLRSSFVFEGELLFCNQMWRVNYSTQLLSHAARHPIKLAWRAGEYAKWLTACSRAWAKLVEKIAVHNLLTFEVKDRFKERIVAVQLYHGERERFMRHWPEASNAPMDVLSKLREGDYMVSTQLQKAPIPTLIAPFLEQMLPKQASATGPLAEAFPLLQNEKECILLTKIGTHFWLTLKETVRSKDIDRAFIMEEFDGVSWNDRVGKKTEVMGTSFEQMEAIFRRHKRRGEAGVPLQCPCLVKLMRVYYVFDMNGPSTELSLYATHHFTEAYFLWLTLCVRDQLVRREALHDDMQEPLSQLARMMHH